jgi:hypothetical protein
MRFRIFERSRSPEDQMRGNPELLQAGDCSGPSQMPVIASKGIRPGPAHRWAPSCVPDAICSNRGLHK